MADQRLNLIKEEIRKLNPALGPDEPGFQAAVTLMAAAFITGPDTERLAEFTEYPSGFVAGISKRMQRAGLWKDNAVESDHWFNGDKATHGLWADSLVAVGLAEARQDENGEWQYRAVK